jgi:hypothetical protein
MLARTSYATDYVDSCRARVAAQVAAYRSVAEALPAASSGDFEKVFFANMVLTLDSYFTHRGRAQEGKDGNPINEVRLLCGSIIEHADVMTLDKTIKWNAANSVLGYKAGDTITVSEADFVRLAEAYFAEITARFPA